MDSDIERDIIETDYVSGLLAEIHRLKTGLWDIAIICGEDIDPQDTYKQLAAPDIVEFAQRAVRDLRKDYDDALDEGIF